ncbi:hypothetical protein CEXT_341341 [Caerostris extrusa]|uniref:Uncharacterized protein n=1 Tax=Caerostris extrusa TaxID=172846 RepID=A0AAV4MPT9_CAEEX|nr:hypothetical protein CEXT_341341 [Caerostris extrusa]
MEGFNKFFRVGFKRTGSLIPTMDELDQNKNKSKIKINGNRVTIRQQPRNESLPSATTVTIIEKANAGNGDGIEIIIPTSSHRNPLVGLFPL